MTITSAVLIEGRNFYAGCKRWAPDQVIDFVGFRNLLQQETQSQIAQLNYYMGVDQNGHLPLESSHRINDSIEQLKGAGYTVKTFPLRVRTTRCHECGVDGDDVVEKQVDTAIAVDAMRAIHEQKTDLFVLVSSDSDQLPLIQAIKQAKKQCWLVAWQVTAVSNVMAEAVDRILVLEPLRESFLRRPTTTSDLTTTKPSAEDLLAELAAAEQQCARGYVGLHHFLTMWRSNKIPRSTAERSTLLNELIANGKVLQYTAHDGHAALKRG